MEVAFRRHREYDARPVLADQVDLGKTVQLGLSARLTALHDDKPALILTPKTLRA